MEDDTASTYTGKLSMKMFEIDALCFNKCVKNPDKKFSSKEEDCLSKKLYIE